MVSLGRMILIVGVLATVVGIHAEGLPSPTRALTLVEAGKTQYVIVVGGDAIPAERFAAEELALHRERMSGVKLSIATDADALPAKAILLGRTRFLKDLGVEVDWEQLGQEGYLLRVAGAHLMIAGGRPRGTLYGVYALLEDHLGCRWFTPDTSVIPERKTIELPPLNVTGQPAFEYREPWLYVGYIWSTWWSEHFDQDYVSRTRHSGNRVDNTGRHTTDDRHGGYFKIPHFGHNLSELVPAKDYAATHPEYFALHNGKRVTQGDLELCLTHPDVARIAAETMREWMRAEPDADMFFIAQSDTSNYCQCERCLTAIQTYEPGSPRDEHFGGWGGRAGLNLHFVKQVAALLEDEFPHLRIGTFAYGATRRPPSNIKAHRNVVIWYCPIERCACHPIDQGPINKDFYDFAGDIQKWTQIAREVYLYDYGRNRVLDVAPTARAAHRLGVGGVMVDAIIDIQSGFGFLRYWLWSESLRNPDWDAEAGRREFLRAYYGAAEPHIEGYLQLVADPDCYEPLREETAQIWNDTQLPPDSSEERRSLWRHRDSPKREELVHGCHLGYRRLTDEAIDEGYALFEQALQVTAGDPKARRHVEAARMELQYALLEHLPPTDPRLKDEAVRLLRLAKELDMPTIGGKPLNEYRDQLSQKLGATIPE